MCVDEEEVAEVGEQEVAVWEKEVAEVLDSWQCNVIQIAHHNGCTKCTTGQCLASLGTSHHYYHGEYIWGIPTRKYMHLQRRI